MSPAALWTLLILCVTVAALVREWLPNGVVGLSVIAALVVTGVLEADEAFAGLTNSAVLTVGCMYVLSAGVVRTGAAALVANALAGKKAASPARAYVVLLLATLVASAFLNNTPLVLVTLPLVLGLAERMREAPSRLLIPLSYLSILGGTCTLIGTSTNLVVASSLETASEGRLTLGLFAFTPLGVPLALAGATLVLCLRRRLLPVRASLGLRTRQGVAVEYLTEFEIGERSPLIGRALGAIEAEAALGPGLRLLEVVRGDVIRRPRPELRVEAGDLLLVKGEPDAVLALRLRHAADAEERERLRGVALSLFELLIPPGSPWVGRRVSELELHERYDASVFAIQRHGAHHRAQIEDLAVQAGDVLLVQGGEAAIHKLRDSRAALVVEGVDELRRDRCGAPIALLAMALFVALGVSQVVPVEIAALLAALLFVWTRIVPARSVYETVGWDVLFLVAGTLALGRAFERTGLAADAADALVRFAAPFGLRATLAVLLVLTTLLTQVLSNNATAAIMTPLAYETGTVLGEAGPMPFVMAVAFGANCSFLTPVAFKTNLLVHGPGGYRFTDFLRMGLPLTAVTLGLAIVLIPILY